MPELPEVETVVRDLKAAGLVGLRVVDARVLWKRSVAAPSGRTPAHSTAVIEVRDHGPGVPAGEAKRVFQRFYRADTARDRGHGGSGVGLTISRAIVRAHGGELTASSAGPGTGATFTLTLPAASWMGQVGDGLTES